MTTESMPLDLNVGRTGVNSNCGGCERMTSCVTATNAAAKTLILAAGLELMGGVGFGRGKRITWEEAVVKGVEVDFANYHTAVQALNYIKESCPNGGMEVYADGTLQVLCGSTLEPHTTD